MINQKSEVKSRKANSKSLNENGIALVMILVLSVIALAIMAGLIYMITTGTQVSGMQKKYETAREASIGGADITYQIIGRRGEASDTASFLNDLSSLNPIITITNSCTGTNRSGVSFTGLAAKLNTPTDSWSAACGDKKMTIITTDTTSYDFKFDLGASPYPTYSVYAKIVDVVDGNSGPDTGLLKGGVVSSSGGASAVVSRPYLYTLEVNTENQANPQERAKYSILYQY